MGRVVGPGTIRWKHMSEARGTCRKVHKDEEAKQGLTPSAQSSLLGHCPHDAGYRLGDFQVSGFLLLNWQERDPAMLGCFRHL